MPRVVFTTALQRHTGCPEDTVEGATVRAALDAYFARHAAARAYVLDEQGELRHHVVVFVDGAQVRDRASLGEAVAPGAEIYVMQALSGG
ncbi:MAG: MoaD/ThiS family protein [Polyangiaceae bacterium]